MKISHGSPFAHLAPPQAPLADERTELERAETVLWAARERLKAAATREGKSTDRLLAQTQFVPRAVAEKWCDNAYDRGQDEARAELLGFVEASRRKSNVQLAPRAKPPAEYFEKLDRAAAMMSDPALAHFDVGTRASIAVAVAAVSGDDHSTSVQATSEGIVRAGRMRRVEIPTPAAPREQNDVHVTPELILRAAKKRRGELN